MARMDENLRQQTDQLRTVAASRGRFGKSGPGAGSCSVTRWSNTRGQRRVRRSYGSTCRRRSALKQAIFAWGAETRADINDAVQKGLRDEGTLKGDGSFVTVLQNINLTREELRYAQSYEKGQQLQIQEVIPELGLRRGVAEVRRTFANGRVEVVQNGRAIKFNPQRMGPHDRQGSHVAGDLGDDPHP